ncbi:MAG: bifunctional demethylmenaquinone methyltransferase/2-methoxy-6-polyprenyl-1,4-benzoquinol methylase UbiE [Deltaproteobacteria bacterium]
MTSADVNRGAHAGALAPADALGSGAMFDRIARRYDLLNRVLSMGIDHGWRRMAAERLALAGRARPEVLDLATGTADLAIAIARRYPEAKVRGTDPSGNMLSIGADKVAARGMSERVSLAMGDAQSIALPDQSVDAVTISFGIRNVPDRELALREMARVTREGGIVAVLELGEPRQGLLGPFARFHIRHVVPQLGALLSGAREYRYLQRSIAAFPEPEVFAAMMERAGLRTEVVPLTFGVCNLYVGRKEARAS